MFVLRGLLDLPPTSNVILIDCVEDKTACCVPASVYSEREYQSSASALSRHRAAIKRLPGAGKHATVAFMSKVINKDSFSFL